MFNAILGAEAKLGCFLRPFEPLFGSHLRESFATYMGGLFLEHRRVSVQSLWERAPLSHYQNLQYFLSEAKWDPDLLNRLRVQAIAKNRRLRSTRDGVLAVDDTGCPKPYAEKTEAVQVQYCPPLGETARCHVTVFSAFAADDRHFPVRQRPYRPAADFPDGEAAPGFRSKIQIAWELICDALDRGVRFSDVVFDSWFAAAWLLNDLTDRLLPWITELKENRRLLVRGKWVRADELVTLIPSVRFRQTVTAPNRDQKPRTFRLTAFETRLRGVRGKVLVVVALGSWDSRDPHRVHVFVTSHRSIDPAEVVRRYALRWKIERIFRELKDVLGFDQYQVRKLRGVSRHWALVLLAHTYLQLLLTQIQGLWPRRPATLGDALKVHRFRQDEANVAWIRHYRVVYHLTAVSQPYMDVMPPRRARVA